jgi:hypothetical protein
VTWLNDNFNHYDGLIEEHLPTIKLAKNLIEFNGRYIYLKCVPCQLAYGRRGYAYIGLDIIGKAVEDNLFFKADNNGMTTSDVFKKVSSHGVFVLGSSNRMEASEILPIYFIRKEAENIFDIGNEGSKWIPQQSKRDSALCGHLLLTFISTAIIKLLEARLLGSQYNHSSFFINARNHKCIVNDKKIKTQEVFKKAHDCYKLLGIDCPAEILR